MKYVDTDVFAYWATDHPDHGERATQIIRHIELNEKGVTSAISFWVFNNLMRNHDGYNLQDFLDQVGRLRNLKVVPLDADTLARADALAREHGVQLQVAVAAVVAKAKGADGVYSRNPEFDKVGVRRIWA